MASEPGNAAQTGEGVRPEPQLGNANRGWYSRGYLPHFDVANIYQSITYRLADSLPAVVLRQLSEQLRGVPAHLQQARRREHIDGLLDSGFGSCALREPANAASVIDTWKRFDGERYDLIAWVVMPNHVHLLVRTHEGVALAKIVQSWKSYTGRRMRSRSAGSSTGSVWMRDYWDRAIRDERHFRAVIDYIHQNPVKAGLVGRPEDWLWSSAIALPTVPS